MTTTTNPYTLDVQAAIAALEAGHVIETPPTVPWMDVPVRFVKSIYGYLRGFPGTPRSVWFKDCMFPLGVLWRVVPEDEQRADDRIPLEDAYKTVDQICNMYKSRKPDMP